MAEWFHILVQLVDGKWLDQPNILDKNEVKRIIKDYNNGKTIYIKLTYPRPKDIVFLLIFRTFNSLPSPTIEEIMKTQDVTGNFKVKSQEEILSNVRRREREEKTEDIPRKVLGKGTTMQKSNTVFIVHGHDETAKNELFVLLTYMGLKPRILKEEADEGKTIIEKLEDYSSNVGYAIILLTPDDVGGKDTSSLKPRARQNVILELGYFMGKIDRRRILCLIRGRDTEAPLEIPSDTLGIVTHRFTQKVEECSKELYRSLRAAGYNDLK